ncbi:MAG TPA: tetratricopeptide repeat protein [Beijerinckiaceae bacterium]|nr:tetratricopeptide repeat protein [Beijerinckiaceae bacterium]
MNTRTESEFERLAKAAAAHHEGRRFVEAEAAYRAALAIRPRHAPLLQNLGVLLAAEGRERSALDCFETSIVAEPHYVSAHYNRAALLEKLGRSSEAIRSFELVSSLEPEHYDAHRALGFLWLAEGNRGRSLDHFARTYELRRGEDRTGIADRSLTQTTRGKLRHDGEQFRFLSCHQRGDSRFEMLARVYEDMAGELPDGIVSLSDRDLDKLGQAYNTAIDISDAPEIRGRAVSERADRTEILDRFSDGAGATYFDDLLTPPALDGLKRYLLESTIWHDFGHIDGFVASYLEDGLACPLMLQIADEIRDIFPELLKHRPLSQAWAFKSLQPCGAIDAHVDDGAISVNFWVTPDAANLRPGRGGLAVCHTPPPIDFRMKGYDLDQQRAKAFLERHAENIWVVPYRENRAVLFESQLVHGSDAPEFAAGYENKRINITLLFGRHDDLGRGPNTRSLPPIDRDLDRHL